MDITFTWRQDAPEDIERVYLHITGVHDHHVPDLHEMEQGTGQDAAIWASTVDVPDDLTASYLVLPLTAEEAAAFDAEEDSRARWVRLVGNAVPHTLDHPGWRPPMDAGFTGTASGRLIMPDAPERPGWEEADVPSWERGSLGGHTLWTSGLRTAEYLLVISDGVNWAGTALPAALDRLHGSGRLPRIGVVAVDTQEDRVALLSRSTVYRDLVADRVIPWAWERMPGGFSAGRTVVTGESLGGLAAVDLVLTRPDAALSAVSTSGSFWFPDWRDGRIGGEVAAEIREGSVPRGTRVHLSAGHGESSGENSMVAHSRAVHAALCDAGAYATIDTANHGHEMAGWTGALTRGLIALLGDRT